MSKASEAANAVVSAIEQVCNLYGVDTFRMQSRVVMVEGAAGRIRPMYFGKWKDRFGTIHSSGMADILARPQLPVMTPWIMNIHDSKDPNSLVDIIEHGAGNPHSLRVVLACVRKDTAIRIIDDQREQARRTVTVPLWIEGKSGKGRLSPEQTLFRAHVEWNNETFLLIHDDVRPLIEWFESRGIRKCEVCGGVKWLQPSGQRLATPCSKCNPRSEFKR